jgi:hypothetical protein
MTHPPAARGRHDFTARLEVVTKDEAGNETGREELDLTQPLKDAELNLQDVVSCFEQKPPKDESEPPQ